MSYPEVCINAEQLKNVMLIYNLLLILLFMRPIFTVSLDINVNTNLKKYWITLQTV